VSTTSAAKNEPGLRGAVLEVVQQLIAAGRDDDALAVIAKLVDRNAELEKLVAAMRAKRNASESIPKEQLDLFLGRLRDHAEGAQAAANDALENAADENGGRKSDELPKPPRQPPVRRPAPPHLPRVDNPIAIPADELPCPRCGKERRCIHNEVTEVVDFKPAEVFVRRDIRPIVACDDCEAEVARAPMGDKVVPGGAYGSALVAELLIGKYRDGLPLHRQGEIFERLGLSIPSSSMSDQIQWATDLLRPIWRALLAQVLTSVVMHVDATSLPVRDQATNHQVVLGALWGYVGQRQDGSTCAAFLYTSTAKKSAQRPGELGPEDFLRRRDGPIVADASSIFDATFVGGRRTEVGCNMHARRYFVKALEAGDARAAVPIKAFKALYDVEADAKGASDEARCALRQSRSRPVFDELVSWCRTYQATEPPGSALAAAIRYLLNHRIALTRYIDDGALPIDNGVVERLHRRPAVGRRSFLFAGSHAGGDRAAIAYSILASCELADVNPREYLSDVLPRIARDGLRILDVAAMTPATWAAARRTAQPAHA
jgi:transposase